MINFRRVLKLALNEIEYKVLTEDDAVVESNFEYYNM